MCEYVTLHVRAPEKGDFAEVMKYLKWGDYSFTEIIRLSRCAQRNHGGPQKMERRQEDQRGWSQESGVMCPRAKECGQALGAGEGKEWILLETFQKEC